MVQLLQPMPTLMLRAALRLGMRERVLRLHEHRFRGIRLNIVTPTNNLIAASFEEQVTTKR
jgi:hypothetical protein